MNGDTRSAYLNVYIRFMSLENMN